MSVSEKQKLKSHPRTTENNLYFNIIPSKALL